MSSTGDGSLAEEAASWFLKLNDPDCSEVERRGYESWLARDALHREEYRKFEQLWQALDGVPKKRRMRKAALAGVALLASALALLLQCAPVREQQLIATAIGEHRHAVLADGTALDVNAGSRVRVRYDWFARRLEVEAGEVLITVVPESLRAFEVRAGNGVLRDIGTTFDVTNENGQVTVGVIEGKVEVRLDGRASGVMMTDGQQLAYDVSGKIDLSQFDAESATAWRNGRWIFQDTPLNDVIARMNRQHVRQTMLADPTLARLHVSGIFNIADRDGLLRSLEVLYHLKETDECGATHLNRLR